MLTADTNTGAHSGCLPPLRPRPLQQLRYLAADLGRIINGRRTRLPLLLFHPWALELVCYRTSRALYLLLGPGWKVIRALLAPLHFLLGPWTGRYEIPAEADIGGGLLVLHGALGVVISKHARIGRNCTLAGGNCIGVRKPIRPGELVIGDHVLIGANAVVLGPVHIGDRARIGAGAVVTHDIAAGEAAAGRSARTLVRCAQAEACESLGD